jgi:hypothetical protein
MLRNALNDAKPHGACAQPPTSKTARLGAEMKAAIGGETRGAMDDRPRVDDRDPADAIQEMVSYVLKLAETWVAWDGTPFTIDDRVYTPHKAIRRVADHMIDHLAQLETHLAEVPPLPDEWHASSVTTPADFALFQPEDLDEARSRLSRLAQIWRIRLATVPAEKMDAAEGDAYTPREMAFHVVESTYYADALGPISRRPKPD